MGAGCPSPLVGMGQGIGERGLAETRIPVAQGGRGMSRCLPAWQLRHTSSMPAMRWEAARLSSAGEVFASHGIYKPLTPVWSELSLHPMKIQGGCSLLDLIPTLLTLPILRAGWFWLLSEPRCAVCLELLYQGFPSQPSPR